jgi:hypothetical protein
MESEIQPDEGLGGKELLVKIVVTAIGRGGAINGTTKRDRAALG